MFIKQPAENWRRRPLGSSAPRSPLADACSVAVVPVAASRATSSLVVTLLRMAPNASARARIENAGSRRVSSSAGIYIATVPRLAAVPVASRTSHGHDRVAVDVSYQAREKVERLEAAKQFAGRIDVRRSEIRKEEQARLVHCCCSARVVEQR